jgi:hypothetical protein
MYGYCILSRGFATLEEEVKPQACRNKELGVITTASRLESSTCNNTLIVIEH